MTIVWIIIGVYAACVAWVIYSLATAEKIDNDERKD